MIKQITFKQVPGKTLLYRAVLNYEILKDNGLTDFDRIYLDVYPKGDRWTFSTSFYTFDDDSFNEEFPITYETRRNHK